MPKTRTRVPRNKANAQPPRVRLGNTAIVHRTNNSSVVEENMVGNSNGNGNVSIVSNHVQNQNLPSTSAQSQFPAQAHSQYILPPSQMYAQPPSSFVNSQPQFLNNSRGQLLPQENFYSPLGAYQPAAMNFAQQPFTQERRRPLMNIQNQAAVSTRGPQKVVFSTPTNILEYFERTVKGQVIADDLNDDSVAIDKRLRDEAINFALDILYEANQKKLDLGTRKKTILANVAKSLVLTFPRLKNPVARGENLEWEYVRV